MTRTNWMTTASASNCRGVSSATTGGGGSCCIAASPDFFSVTVVSTTGSAMPSPEMERWRSATRNHRDHPIDQQHRHHHHEHLRENRRHRNVRDDQIHHESDQCEHQNQLQY